MSTPQPPHRPVNPDRPGYLWDERVGWVPAEMKMEQMRQEQEAETGFRRMCLIVGLIIGIGGFLFFLSLLPH